MSENKLATSGLLVYLGLGSNVGDSEFNLKQSIVHILELQGVFFQSCSSLYITPPWGVTEQSNFYNCVLAIKTTLSAHNLLLECQKIELQFLRERTQIWGPRTLDIDIVWINNHAIVSSDLIVPHPYLFQRAFVLVPLSEIDARFTSALNRLPDDEVSAIVRQNWS